MDITFCHIFGIVAIVVGARTIRRRTFNIKFSIAIGGDSDFNDDDKGFDIHGLLAVMAGACLMLLGLWSLFFKSGCTILLAT